MTRPGTPQILAVILARGGSKGIPHKNIKPLNGHPLIAYTITAALKSRLVTDLVVSTDDEEIARVAREYGAQTPFMRPAALAEDHVFSRDALNHAVLESEKHFGKQYDYVVELPCVAPLRDGEDIDTALEKLIETGADSVISVCQMQDKHPVRMKRIKDDQLSDFCKEFPEGEGSRRQDLEPCFIRNGAIYSMTRRTIIEEFSRNGAVSRPFSMEEERSVNIDSMIDFYLAESLIRRGFCRNHPVKINPETKIETFPSSGKPRLLFSAGYEFMPELKDYLCEHFSVTFAYNAPRSRVEELLPDCDAWICSPCPAYAIDKALIDTGKNLRVIATPSTGTNHIDLGQAGQKGIPVVSLKDSPVIEDIHASAEFSFALLLAMVKKIPFSYAQARVGVWREREAEFRNIELNGKTLGIIGCGRIGSKMARFAEGFGMNVLACDPYRKIDVPSVRQVERKELLSGSDIVAVHVHLNDETRRMADAGFFHAMKEGAYFLNTSRGDIVEEPALIDALESGKLKAAAVDVISREDEPDKWGHPLVTYAREHENLILTPHVAGATVESEYKAGRYVAEQVLNHLKPSTV